MKYFWTRGFKAQNEYVFIHEKCCYVAKAHVFCVKHIRLKNSKLFLMQSIS